ncbi:hypothetical protein [Roseibium sp.]|uniref:hypothetical protein n=1 Tax=Roseibium sp. TaxID=1936156 RepID=UPI003A96CF21
MMDQSCPSNAHCLTPTLTTVLPGGAAHDDKLILLRVSRTDERHYFTGKLVTQSALGGGSVIVAETCLNASGAFVYESLPLAESLACLLNSYGPVTNFGKRHSRWIVAPKGEGREPSGRSRTFNS